MANDQELKGRGAAKNASAADVAREAGVSVSAVSRAFTTGASISPRMRIRVLEAAEKLNYVPNAMARSLMTQRTHLIGVIMANFTNPVYLTVLDCFTRILQQRGLRMILLNVARTDELDATAKMIMEYGIDALVVSAGAISPLLTDKCVARQIPLVAFLRRPRRSRLHVVCADNVAGGYMAARHLIEAGHQRLGFIGGPRTASTSEDRLEGFRQAAAEAGLEVSAVEFGTAYTFEDGKAAARRLLVGDDPPTGLFCAGDMLALGALDCARFELGYVVPDDLSIIGFDNIGFAAAESYDLSTINQPVEEMVIETVNLLERSIEDYSTDWKTRLFACSFVPRGTVGPAPTEGPVGKP